jgi:hypothetical protein
VAGAGALRIAGGVIVLLVLVLVLLDTVSPAGEPMLFRRAVCPIYMAVCVCVTGEQRCERENFARRLAAPRWPSNNIAVLCGGPAVVLWKPFSREIIIKNGRLEQINVAAGGKRG